MCVAPPHAESTRRATPAPYPCTTSASGAWNELLHVAGQYGMGLKKDSLGAVIVEILEKTLNKPFSKEERRSTLPAPLVRPIRSCL